MANNFKVWVNTPIEGQQVQFLSAFETDEQRVNGFKAGNPASAIRVNTALRQANVVVAGLMEFCDELKELPEDLSLLSTVTEVKDAIEDSFNEWHNTNISGLENALQELQNEVDGKQDALTFDDAPTIGSDNPVKSRGIKSYVDSAIANMKSLSVDVSLSPQFFDFIDKTWSGLTNLNGQYIWTDGNNIYYSRDSTQKVLDIVTSIWSDKTWSGLTSFIGDAVWTDGTNIYYSWGLTQKVLNVATSTWSDKTWSGMTEFYGNLIWTDGTNIYYSYDSTQKVLNVATSTWSDKTWSGMTEFYGYDIWTDGNNIYYSRDSTQKVLDIVTSIWSDKTWSGLTNFGGSNVWTDGTNIYYSYHSTQKVLDVATNIWSDKTWSGPTSFYGDYIWSDGINIYYSYDTTQKVLITNKKIHR